MSYSYVEYTGDGSTKIFNVPFSYIAQNDVTATVNGTPTSITWPSSTQVEFATAPASGAAIVIYRTTQKTSRLVDYQSTTLLDEATLDKDSNQIFFVAQEGFDAMEDALTLDSADNKYDANSKVIKNVANAVNDNDAVNKSQITSLTSAAVAACQAAQAAAETAETNAETAETNAETAETNAAASASAAATAKTGAETAEAKAEKWADEAEDVEVETGKYSAKHWSAKAEGFADSINTPTLTADDVGKGLRVKSTYDGYELTQLFRKNLIINGNFRITQRDDWKSNQGDGDSGYEACDRWRFSEYSTIGGQISYGRDTTVPTGEGFSSSFKVECATVEAAVDAAEAAVFEQRIEAQFLQHLKYGTSNAEDITLSFWIKTVNKSGTLCVAVLHDDATYSYIHEVSVTAGSWQKVTITIPGYTATAIANDNGIGLSVCFCLFAGSTYQGTADSWQSGTLFATSNQSNFLDSTSNVINITGVQLEVGSVATEFEHRPLSAELILCQRYYEKNHDMDDNPGPSGSTPACFSFSTSSAGTYQPMSGPIFKVTKRATPTCQVYTADGTSGKVRDLSTPGDCNISDIPNGNTNIFGRHLTFASDPGNNIRIAFDWTADAEL